jgi:hypothetical protein
MGKRLNDFKEKICKNGTPCGNSCISKIKNCLKSKKTGDSAQPGKTGNSSAKKKDPANQSGSAAPGSYKADSADHTALIKIGERFSGETMGKALKSLDDSISEKKAAFKSARITKKGDVYKQDMKRLQELDKKTQLAQENLESAAVETTRRIAAHHKIDREDAELWANSVDTRGLPGSHRETVLESLIGVYVLTGGKGGDASKGGLGVIEIVADADRAYALLGDGKIALGQEYDDSDQLRRCTFHEYAHFTEYANPGITIASRKFIESRATSLETEKLNIIDPTRGYRDDEIAFRDQFVSPYVGKIYGDAGTPTEVVSMGIDRFRNSAVMAEFYKQDREHFNFVLGAILHEN